MSTPALFNDQSTMEPGPTSLFPNFVGVDNDAILALDVDGGTAVFTVGDLVTGGTSAATGVVRAINGSTGTWDVPTHTGAATLILATVTGTFQNDEAVTGAPSLGAAVANGTGTAGTIPGGFDATVTLTVTDGEVDFKVADTVTGGTSSATGVVLSFTRTNDETRWDASPGTGTGTLVLGTVVGTFEDAEEVSGALAGTAIVDGDPVSGFTVGGVTSVKGKGIVGVTSSPAYAASPYGLGKYVITLKNQWAGLLCVKASVVSSASADDYEVVILSETVASTKTVTLQLFKGGAVAALQSTDKLLLELVLATSKMVPISY